MPSKMIYITKQDMKKLRTLIASVQAGGTKTNLENLEKELDRAKVVSPQKVPKDVITMNSRVRIIDIESNKESIYTIVFPAEANVENNKISVLAPIGTALIGYRVGDSVEWKVPSGLKRFQIMETLYQPEAAGDYS